MGQGGSALPCDIAGFRPDNMMTIRSMARRMENDGDAVENNGGNTAAGVQVPGILGRSRPGFLKSRGCLSELVMPFGLYCLVEKRFSQRSAARYAEVLKRVIRLIGNVKAEDITVDVVTELRRGLEERERSPACIKEYIAVLKAFLRFCREGMNLETMSAEEIAYPHIPWRQVSYLTKDEVRKFVEAIPVGRPGQRTTGAWMRLRTIVEVLLGTGMRIAECLSLRFSTIDFDSGTARIIGKGDKDRTVFFTPRALEWVKTFLKQRESKDDLLFTGPSGHALGAAEVQRCFRAVCRRVQLQKRVTPHLLRHTVATTLLFAGCPIGHIKDILGHARLQTTCRYYLGRDQRAAKDAHRKYLAYE